MATDGPTPPPCNQKIFKKGEAIVAVTGSSNAVERWVKSIAKKANTKVDWHYVGCIAQVLHLGNNASRERAVKAIEKLIPKLDGNIFRKFYSGEKGFYRAGVTNVPKGTIAVSTETGRNEFMVKK